MPEVLAKALKELGMPRLVIWGVIALVAIGSLVATTSMASFSVGLRAEDLSNRLASLQTAVGKMQATLDDELPAIRKEMQSQQYQIDGLNKLVGSLSIQFAAERENVAGRIDRAVQQQASANERLSSIEASASAAREEVGRLSTWMLNHRGELPRFGAPAFAGSK